jgi:hypothetical protein
MMTSTVQQSSAALLNALELAGKRSSRYKAVLGADQGFSMLICMFY